MKILLYLTFVIGAGIALDKTFAAMVKSPKKLWFSFSIGFLTVLVLYVIFEWMFLKKNKNSKGTDN